MTANASRTHDIDVADDGTFYGSSENGLCAGTNAWKATATDATHYQELT